MYYITERITLDPDLCNGKPTIKGKRMTVQTVLGLLSVGETKKEILYQYPFLEEEDIKAYLGFAASMMNNEFSIQKIAS